MESFINLTQNEYRVLQFIANIAILTSTNIFDNMSTRVHKKSIPRFDPPMRFDCQLSIYDVILLD